MLGFLKAGTCAAVQGVDPLEHHNSQHGDASEEQGDQQHEHSHCRVGLEHHQGGDPATEPPTRDANGLQDKQYILDEENEEEDEEIERTVTPVEKAAGRVGEESGLEDEAWGLPWARPPAPSPYRKALYMGRYQQTKEQGVKRRTQRMERPKPEPLLVSTQKLAKQARKFKSRARVLHIQR